MTTKVKMIDYYLEKTAKLSEKLAEDAVERDQLGGTPRPQLKLLRESGLLNISIPIEYGGEGEPWSVLLRIVRELAKVDASIAHIYGFHFASVLTPYYRGTTEQSAYYFSETVNNNWFWGNSINTKDKRLFSKIDGNKHILNGVKSFSSGSPGSDHLVITWREEATGDLYYGAVPTNREGITVNEDWQGIGQRQTGSGSVEFQNVVIEQDEILSSDLTGGNAFPVSQILPLSLLISIFAGSAEGALAEAKKFVVNKYRTDSDGLDKEAIDPTIYRRFGDLWIQTRGAISLAEEAGVKLDRAWEKKFNLNEQEFTDLTADVISANVLAGEVALKVTSEIFEVMGARSATTKYGFDRFWRNVRTHTLHDSIENKLRNVGTWVVTDEFPSMVPTK